jgi:putative ABC transport system ATP-binding protein
VTTSHETSSTGPETSSGLAVHNLAVEYRRDGYSVRPFEHLSLRAQPGELTVLLGPSGSGKTTLLSCLGGILTPADGTITVDGAEVTAMKARALERYRRDQVGFVFQAFNLIPSLTAQENVAVPLMLAGRSHHDAMAKAAEVLGRVGLSDRLHSRPGQLSGGQQQRVAVARGLAHDPVLLLADEPTANLDYVQAEGVIRLLRDLRDDGRVIVVSTHDARLVPIADQVVTMGPEVSSADGPPQSVSYAAGEVIFAQGDRSDLVYVIESGSVEIFRPRPDGGEQRLAVLPEGQYFGELGPLLGFPRSASARAQSDVALTAYGPRDFRQQVLDDS